MSYWYFLSYARSDRDPYLERFTRDLDAAIRRRSGDQTLPTSFVDETEIEVGEKWDQRLFDALQSSGVLVPLYTPTYFQRPVCGREWSVFEARLAATHEQFKDDYRPPVILPILWLPEDLLPEPLPAVANDIQYKHADFGQQYAEVGLRQMMAVSKYRNRYRELVDRFADTIIEVVKEKKNSLSLAPIDFSDAKDVFRRTQPGVRVSNQLGPRYVKFVYVAATRGELEKVRRERDGYGENAALEWHPYHPDVPDEIVMLAQDVVTSSRKLIYQEIPFTPDQGTSLLEALKEAESSGNIIVIIVDPWSLRLKGYFSSMQECDALAEVVRYVVACPWNSDPETTAERTLLQNALNGAFQRGSKREPHYFLSPINSAPDLKGRLADSIEFMRKIRMAAHEPDTGGSALPLVSAV